MATTSASSSLRQWSTQRQQIIWVIYRHLIRRCRREGKSSAIWPYEINDFVCGLESLRTIMTNNFKLFNLIRPIENVVETIFGRLKSLQWRPLQIARNCSLETPIWRPFILDRTFKSIGDSQPIAWTDCSDCLASWTTSCWRNRLSWLSGLLRVLRCEVRS